MVCTVEQGLEAQSFPQPGGIHTRPTIESNPSRAVAGANAVREWLERWIVEGEFNEIGGGRAEEPGEVQGMKFLR